jgi:hypothetical protein
MLGKVEVLLSHEYTLAEEVLVDLLAVSFGDKPGREVLAEYLENESIILHCCEFQALFGESHTTLKFLGWWSKVVVKLHSRQSFFARECATEVLAKPKFCQAHKFAGLNFND